ncbi:TPA: transposase, partial [Mannheimia haemolytica]|nr:transposase [Mannheimia haemolytica]HDL1705447.1 transposase [Mannheimia haemolytica]HDL3682277.1 transposase [Mannheimia haemolytica]HDL4346037.1 transposase [Mannheimia haemolytica]HDL5796199.1 transposase [Mannheimia haemolytica]
MGMSRDTSYRYQQAVEQSGVDALLNQNRRVPNLKNRVDEATEQAVVKFAFDNPAFGQVRVSNELRKQGIFISAGGVRSIWLRHNLANFKQRLNALEKAVAEKGIILSENQVQALERKKEDDVACGEIETAHPGYLGSQDTFYVGNLKGVGRIYQQTFIDTYSKVAFAKLYTMKTAISAADMLNDKVLPFFESQGLPMLRILTDRGSEYCGKV